MRLHSLWLFTFLLLTSYLEASYELTENKPIVVVIPSYNNIKWLEKNLDSVLGQTYENYRVIYIDDSSKDGTANRVQDYLNEKNVPLRVIDFDDSSLSLQEAVDIFSNILSHNISQFILVKNRQRCGAMANLYRAIHSCRNDEIIATLDGDDWFYHDGVLSQLNEIYSSSEVWFTHGTLMEYPWGNVTWCEPLKPEAIAENRFREFKCPSHLRTFYTWIFKRIPLEDFLFEGQFYPMAWDMAIMFPIAEMSRERHAFIKEVNYVYNMANSINDNKVDPGLQNLLDKIIRSKPRYDRLEE